MGQTVGAAAPVGHIGLVDLIAAVVVGGQAGDTSHCAIDIVDTATDPTDHMMMVIANSGLKPGR